jgi:hypothetical protein
MSMLSRGLALALSFSITCFAFVLGASAEKFKKGVIVEIPANSIWFQDADKLARWQTLRKGADTAAFQAYEQDALSRRDAWQFLKPLNVEILGDGPGRDQVKVRMKVDNRLRDSEWILDRGTIEDAHAEH